VAEAAHAAQAPGLPPALTSFIGRVTEVSKVTGLVAEYRLVTVTGPGGVGKTRLAEEVAVRVTQQFADGVVLVELASIREPGLVHEAVAQALGLRQAAGQELLGLIAGVLARRQLLLLLDNCEHALDAVAELCGALLAAADDVTVLATSREPIGIDGEARYRLGPLALPMTSDPAEITSSEAVLLFADRDQPVRA
jgi:predicted ATPase